MLLLNLTGSRVSMHHTQENSKQLPDSRSHSSPPLNLPPYTLLLHAVYKKHIALLEPLSKSFRSHCEAPISSSLSGGKCKCAGVEMLQSRREVSGPRKPCYLWGCEAHRLKINLHKMTYWKLLSLLLLINASFFFGHRECLRAEQREKD